MPNKPVEIVSTEEPVTVVRLADGTVLKIRLAIHTAFVQVNEDGAAVLLPNGNMNYGVEWASALQIVTPPEVLAAAVLPGTSGPAKPKPPTVN